MRAHGNNRRLHDSDMSAKSLISCKCGSRHVRHSFSDGLHRYVCAVCENKTGWHGSNLLAKRAWNRVFGR